MKPYIDEIELAIATRVGFRQHVIIPNISWGLFNHECDLVVLRSSGYAYEIEIKRSKSDLLADFKKYHHHKDSRLCMLYYAIPDKHYDEWEKLIPENYGIMVYYYVGSMLRASFTNRGAKRRKESRKLTNKEQLTLMRLGCMRIWNLKRKLNGTKA